MDLTSDALPASEKAARTSAFENRRLTVASDIFLKVDGIKGESTDVNHKDEIEVLSWSWGVTETLASSGSGAASGKPNISELVVGKLVDKASPDLFRSCLTGKHIKDVELAERRAGAGKNNFLTITLKDAIITGVHDSSGVDATRPTESISIAFAKVIYEYIPQKPNGQPGTPVVLRWDVKANKEF
jgi:type VI secretion system secreted protein Hcp